MNPAIAIAIERAIVAYVTAHPEIIEKIVDRLIGRILEAIGQHVTDGPGPVQKSLADLIK